MDKKQIEEEITEELASRLVALEGLLRACGDADMQMMVTMRLKAKGGLSYYARDVLEELLAPLDR